MTDPMLGLTMLVLIVVVIVMGFPTAFTLMGLGIVFGFMAFYDPNQFWWDNRVFELMVQRTYGAMTNDVLIAIPLFVLMGYVMERAALVDKMFFSIQLAFRRVPASLAVATLIVCTFMGHRQRPGRSRGRADGRHRDVADVAGRIRREARCRRHHRGRHAWHFDSAVGDDHRLCGGGGAVGRQALCSRDTARPLCWRSCISSTSWAGQ